MLARADPDAKAFGFDRQRFLDLELVNRISRRDLETMQDQGEHERCLVHGELLTDTRPLTVAERLIAIWRPRPFLFSSKVFRIKYLGLGAPYDPVAMETGRQDSDLLAALEEVAAADGRILERHDRKSGRGRPQPQSLSQHLPDKGKLGDLFV